MDIDRAAPSTDEIEALIRREAETSRAAEPPRPLMRQPSAAGPFPMSALGDVLGPAARGIHDKVQAPIAIAAQSVLAAATLAAQPHADILLPTGQKRPLSSFFLTVAATGERKSSCDFLAVSPIRERERALADEYGDALLRHENERAAHEAARREVLSGQKADREMLKVGLDEIGACSAPPLYPALICDEPTYEGLAKMLLIGQPGIGIFTAEGGQFIGGHGMRDEAKMRTASGLSKLWDGDPISRVRAGDGLSVIRGRRMSMHLMAQPEVAAHMLSDPVLKDQGLLSRMLVAAPAPASGTRLWREPRPESDEALAVYQRRILGMLERPCPVSPDRPNELVPPILTLTAEARALYIGYADSIERQIGQGGALEPIRGLANKLAEHAARLAGVLSLIADPETRRLSGEHMAAGIELAEFYAGEALRLFEAGATDPDLRAAERLRQWLLNTWPEPFVSPPDIYQLGPNSIRDKRTAEKMIGILAEHGWLVKEGRGRFVAGRHRRQVYGVVRGGM